MPKGPQGERRPADAVGCAVQVAKIATGETPEAEGKPRPILWLFYEKAALYFNIKRKCDDRDDE